VGSMCGGQEIAAGKSRCEGEAKTEPSQRELCRTEQRDVGDWRSEKDRDRRGWTGISREQKKKKEKKTKKKKNKVPYLSITRNFPHHRCRNRLQEGGPTTWEMVTHIRASAIHLGIAGCVEWRTPNAGQEGWTGDKVENTSSYCKSAQGARKCQRGTSDGNQEAHGSTVELKQPGHRRAGGPRISMVERESYVSSGSPRM